MKDDYIRLQDAALPEYKRNYKKWTDSMTPEELQELNNLGLSKPYGYFICRDGLHAARGKTTVGYTNRAVHGQFRLT